MQRLPNPFSSGGASEAVPLRAAPRLGEHYSEVLETVSRPAMAARAADAPAQALAGLKIVDLAWAVAGPLIGRTLADFGAIVIRVEIRTRVDSARIMGPFPDAVFDAQKSLLFENCNANKLGLTVNLQTEAGRKLLRDLVRSADVLIESFAPGQMERFGMGYPSLQAINPGLVMLSSSLLGQTGPNAAFAGFGNVGGALSGFQQIVGLRDELPIGTYGPYTDFVGPRFGLIALLSALDRRRRTKEGCHLDMSRVEATISLLSPQLLDMACNGRIAQANGNRDAAMAPCGVFPAGGDDRWVAIACKIDSEWRALARAIGGEALADDPRFLNLALRQENEDALEGVLAAWTSSRDAATIEELLQQAGVPAHVVAASPEILGDTHLAATGAFVRLAHPLMGETIFDAARYDLDGTPAQYRRTAPYPGRDNQEVLEELLGYSKSEISMLDAAGALT